MDIHMPDMDGYETIRRIREKEQESNTHVPVVALTANALQGDQEKCLAAGMDGYIPKPFDCDELLEIVHAYLLSQADLEEILNLQVLMKRFHKLELRSKLIDLFKAKLPDYLKQVREAIDTGNTHHLQEMAHKLKGMVGNFSVMGAYEAAHALEKAALNGDLSNIEMQWRQLTYEVDRLKSALNRYRVHLKE
jgi:DNA-binding NarL/FixJ family response regulator